MSIQLINENGDENAFQAICEKWQLRHNPDAILALVQTPERLELRKLDEPKLGAIAVNFVDGTMAHRRKFGGGRGEAVAKAVGIKGSYLPTVIDATAGLGRDAFVLAAIGCKVQLIERNPVVSALLEDGLKRAYQDPEIGEFMQSRMVLLPFHTISEYATANEVPVDVVYFDPMFPHKQKSALVKNAPFIAEQKPDFSQMTKNHRFDVYLSHLLHI